MVTPSARGGVKKPKSIPYFYDPCSIDSDLDVHDEMNQEIFPAQGPLLCITDANTSGPAFHDTVQYRI